MANKKTAQSSSENKSKARSRFWIVVAIIAVPLGLFIALGSLGTEVTSLETSNSITDANSKQNNIIIPKNEPPAQKEEPTQNSPAPQSQQPTYTPVTNNSPQSNYTPPAAPSPPQDPCNYSLKSSYDTQRYTAINNENYKYNREISDANAAIARILNSGGGSSSAYQYALRIKGQIEANHRAALIQIENEYKANIATTGCTI